MKNSHLYFCGRVTQRLLLKIYIYNLCVRQILQKIEDYEEINKKLNFLGRPSSTKINHQASHEYE